MMNRLSTCKTRAARGFTFVEMLAALAVLSIMTAMVTAGVSAGVRAYESSQFVSQSEMLAATIDSTLSEPFRFMRKGTTEGEYDVDFENQTITIASSPRALVTDEDGRLYISGKVGSQSKQVKVVNDGIYGGCRVSLVASSSESCSMDKVEYRYAISNASGTMSRNYSFVVKPLDGVTRDYLINSGGGGGGGGGGGTVDKTNLIAEIDLASSALDAGQKGAAATAALRNALTAAETVRDNPDASVSEVQTAADNLKAARLLYDLEEALPDTMSLIAAINRAPASFDNRFDSSVVNRVRNAYNAAIAQRDNPTSQSKVDEATSELNAALDAYEAQRYADALRSAITSAETALQTERVDANGVTAWLNQALSDARAALSNPAGYSQSQIDEYTQDLQNATAAYNALSKPSSGGGGDDGPVFTFTVNGVERSIPVVKDDGVSGKFSANTLYLYNGSYYFAARDFDSPWNPSLDTLSGWSFADTGIAKVIATTVDASAFTTSDYKCPSKIEKGTLYFDVTRGKLWASHQTQDWLVRPDVNSNGWDDVSGLLSGQ